MDGNTLIVIISVAVNVGVVAFSYGKLSQSVHDLCRRMTKVESIMNGKVTQKEE